MLYGYIPSFVQIEIHKLTFRILQTEMTGIVIISICQVLTWIPHNTLPPASQNPSKKQGETCGCFASSYTTTIPALCAPMYQSTHHIFVEIFIFCHWEKCAKCTVVFDHASKRSVHCCLLHYYYIQFSLPW